MSNVNWILHNSTSDTNYKMAIAKLTTEELAHCLANEKRSSGREQLLREAKKRNMLVVPTPLGDLIAAKGGDVNYPAIELFANGKIVGLFEAVDDEKMQIHVWKTDCSCEPLHTTLVEPCTVCAQDE